MARDGGNDKHLHSTLLAGGVFPYYILIIAVTILVGISTVMVVSASSSEAILKEVAKTSSAEVGMVAYQSGVSHILSILAGLISVFVFSMIDYRKIGTISILGAIAIFLGLVATAILARETLGAQRWIYIGSFSLQVSEIAKPLLLIYSAYIFTHYYDRGRAWSKSDTQGFAIAGGLVGICLLMILFQPDFGTTSIIAFGILTAYTLSGYPWRWLVFAAPIIGVILVARSFISGNYQADRITGFVSGILSGTYAYQVTQGIYALGSGGIFGVGPGLSRQKYYYVPEAQNDSILAIIGEELGLVGTLMIVGAFVAILYAGLKIALGCKDSFGRALAGGATMMLSVQAVINIFAVLGLGPMTGKPLPFVTLGGSAMISSFMLLGILLSVARFGGEKETETVAEKVKEKTSQPRGGVNREHNSQRRGNRGTYISRTRIS